MEPKFFIERRKGKCSKFKNVDHREAEKLIVIRSAMEISTVFINIF